MRKLLLLVAVALAFCFTAVAQGTGTAGSQTTSSTTTSTTTTKTKKTAAAGAAKGQRLTGCLAKNASGTGYTLTNGRHKKGVAVTGSPDFSAHVGHTVRLTGAWEKPTAGAAGGAGATGETMRTFDATSLKHISATCRMAGKASAKGTKAGAAAPAPKS